VHSDDESVRSVVLETDAEAFDLVPVIARYFVPTDVQCVGLGK